MLCKNSANQSIDTMQIVLECRFVVVFVGFRFGSGVSVSVRIHSTNRELQLGNVTTLDAILIANCN